MPEQYLIYLRKSRKDIDAERTGAGETLARHEKELLALAKRQKLTIGAIYKEIVSGETIAARPEMQRLLSEVETGCWAGVLVMEIERLARGDTKDQGIVAEAFKYGNAKIITPAKTYDPENEFDEEYFEFGLFMSRREYKTINRRIQRGRLASVKEGKYIASEAPYGYERAKIKDGKGYTLEIVQEEAQTVKLIFHLYTVGIPDHESVYTRLGSSRIAKHLDSLRIHARKNVTWSASSVRDILANPTYIGKVRWQWRREIKKVANGEVTVSRPKDDDCMLYDGLHEAIIDEFTFRAAQRIRKNRDHSPVKATTTLQNPLSGLIYCKKCGRMMTRLGANKRNKYDTLKCPDPYCDNISAPVSLVEASIMQSLNSWVAHYELNLTAEPDEGSQLLLESQKAAIDQIHARIDQLKQQQSKTFDLLEQEIYTNEIFLERNNALTKQLEDATIQLSELNRSYLREINRNTARQEFIPMVKTMLETYDSLPTPSAKNTWLKQVLGKVTYIKTERNKKSERNNANFEISIFPKIPESQYPD